MVKCLICGKRIWFFQKKGFDLEGKEKLIHLKCYEKQEEEFKKIKEKEENIDEFNKICEDGYNEELKENGDYIQEELTHEEIKELNEKEDEEEKEKEETKELNLSDKIICAKDSLPEAEVLFVSDVQSFIKNIKLRCASFQSAGAIVNAVNDLAGEKLI